MSKRYVPDGSGTFILNICDSNGNIVEVQKYNLSEIAHLEEENNDTRSDSEITKE